MSQRPVEAPPERGDAARRVAVARAAIENLRPDELAEELDVPTGSTTQLVDVRSAEEHRIGTITGAINVPRGRIEISLGARLDRARRIVVFCDTGSRSALAAQTLYELGYSDVAQLDGGLAAWRTAGKPLIPGRADG